MSLVLREDPSPDQLKSNWQQITILLQPIVSNLPNKQERDFFSGMLSLMIGKEPRISNIPMKLVYVYIKKGYFVAKLYKYRSIIGIERVMEELLKLLYVFAFSLGWDGLLVKHGLGGFQRQFIEQKVTQEKLPEEKKKGWF